MKYAKLAIVVAIVLSFSLYWEYTKYTWCREAGFPILVCLATVG